ncbi:asparaginase [soil metagenome]
MSLPGVVVMTTGGTIASVKDPQTRAVRTAATPEDLLALVPDIDQIARVEARPQAAVNSWNMTPPMMLDLVHASQHQLMRSDVSGVVITHGTDTVEETAYLAHLTLDSDKPVVFVVAMRNLSEPGPYGPRNLRDAIRVAIDPRSLRRGAMLVVNETIHSARYVTKTHTVNPSTFASPHGGPIGEVTVVGVEYFGESGERSILTPANVDGNVPIVKSFTGMDGSILRYFIGAGVDGIVIEGSGSGNVPGSILPEIKEMMERGTPVVLTTRCIGGPLAPIYGTGGASGGGHDLVEAGVILASRLTAQKARIALLALLGAGRSTEEIRTWFGTA